MNPLSAICSCSATVFAKQRSKQEYFRTALCCVKSWFKHTCVSIEVGTYHFLSWLTSQPGSNVHSTYWMLALIAPFTATYDIMAISSSIAAATATGSFPPNTQMPWPCSDATTPCPDATTPLACPQLLFTVLIIWCCLAIFHHSHSLAAMVLQVAVLLLGFILCNLLSPCHRHPLPPCHSHPLLQQQLGPTLSPMHCDAVAASLTLATALLWFLMLLIVAISNIFFISQCCIAAIDRI